MNTMTTMKITNTWTIPRRIALGFLALVLLSLLLGGIAIWRIVAVNEQVVALADNTVPSLVFLGKVGQCNARSGRAARRILQLEDDASGQATAEAAYAESRRAGDEACKGYVAIVSDDEDARRFADAQAARTTFYTKADALIELVKDGKGEDAQAWLLKEVDPALEACVDNFNRAIDYNVDLAQKASRAAARIVASSYAVVSGTLALAGLGGILIAWAISRIVSRSLGSISDALEEGATQTAASSGQLSASSQALADGCSEQGSSVAETSAALEEMSVMIRSTADNAEKAKAFANDARLAAQTGSETMSEMNTAMHAIEASSAEVAKIVKNIDEIAFQTNILALNAAVEAARAGEAGAGFAVVADEVRSLAQRSAAAARETADKIEAAILNSKRGSASCGKVGESLEQIVQRVAAADALVAEISTAAKEQAQGIQQVGLAMTQLDKVTQGNSASAEQTASAAEELNSQARILQDAVTFLRSLVGGHGGTGHFADTSRDQLGGVGRQPAILAGKLARPALRRDSGRALVDAKRPRLQIPMPGDQGSGAADQEDRHFTNF